jgi:hypothetical protein
MGGEQKEAGSKQKAESSEKEAVERLQYTKDEDKTQQVYISTNVLILEGVSFDR